MIEQIKLKRKENKTFKTEDDYSKPKYYILDMFPYPSGAGLHVGHPEGYTATDILSRYKRMKGFNVLHPMGYDAFGLPAEQYAIQTGTHPAVTTNINCDNFRRQIKSIGLSAGSVALTSIPFINNARSNEENKLTSFKDVTTYNNYYEFGTSKSDPYINSQNFKTTPWSITIEGEVEKPIKLSMEEITETFISEERIYRLRCVEGWSMVIPWMGFSLNQLLSKVTFTSKAKFVEFESVYDPEQMKGQKYPVLKWPYKEGLRIDEAMHPLTTVVTGLYNKKLPNQNGAPLRIFLPWKYGFKSAKAIVKIKLVEKMPTSSWMRASPREYGFYSNVNPNVDHPRWSQATERVIGNDIFAPRVKTLMFNGYGDEVANLYTGMDLKKYF